MLTVFLRLFAAKSLQADRTFSTLDFQTFADVGPFVSLATLRLKHKLSSHQLSVFSFSPRLLVRQ